MAMLEDPEATVLRDADSRLRHVIRRICELFSGYLPETALLMRVHGNTETEHLVLDQHRALNEVVAGMIAEVRRTGGRADADHRSRLTRGRSSV
nr:hypothetical protein [Nocardia nova]